MSFFTNAFQQRRRWLVVGILGHQLAAEGFGEERRRQPVHLRLGLRVPSLDPVGQREQRLDTVRDFPLFLERRNSMEKKILFGNRNEVSRGLLF